MNASRKTLPSNSRGTLRYSLIASAIVLGLGAYGVAAAQDTVAQSQDSAQKSTNKSKKNGQVKHHYRALQHQRGVR